MDDKFIKVMRVLAEAGITPNELDAIIMPQMSNMMDKLDRVEMNLHHFIAYALISQDIDCLEEMIENVTSSLDT